MLRAQLPQIDQSCYYGRRYREHNDRVVDREKARFDKEEAKNLAYTALLPGPLDLVTLAKRCGCHYGRIARMLAAYPHTFIVDSESQSPRLVDLHPDLRRYHPVTTSLDVSTLLPSKYKVRKIRQITNGKHAPLTHVKESRT